MPLLDHFHPPLSVDRPWEGVHSAWATVIAQHLNDTLLPKEFVALPHVRLGTAVEIDVAAFQQRQPAAVPTSPQAWAPVKPAWSVPVEWDERDVFEVRVYRQEGGPRLVGAVELVSPANKDRPGHRQTFAGKWAGYLRQGVGLVVVDVVTDRCDSLHQELVSLLELNGSAPFAAELYAVSYRTVALPAGSRLDMWPESLAVGRALPTLPLWLGEELPIRLDLESTYQTTCRTLRIE